MASIKTILSRHRSLEDHRFIFLLVNKSDDMYKSSLRLLSFLIIFIFAAANESNAQGRAQKIGHFDSEFVLNQMPEYKLKQKELESLAQSYSKEVRSLYDQVEKLRSDLRVNEVLLTPAMKQEREQEILTKEQQALKKNTEYFGYDGLYYKKIDELVLPLRTKVAQAVEVVARKNGLDYIFDKAADVGIVYSNPVHDYTEFVIEELELNKEKGD